MHILIKGFYVNLGDTVNFMEFNGDNYHDHEKFLPLILPNDHSDGQLCFILENDDAINYRGVHINELKIIQECEPQLGDLNGDCAWNVIDIIALVNCVLDNNCDIIGNGCYADMNNDIECNVMDVVVLADCILNVNC